MHIFNDYFRVIEYMGTLLWISSGHYSLTLECIEKIVNKVATECL